MATLKIPPWVLPFWSHALGPWGRKVVLEKRVLLSLPRHLLPWRSNRAWWWQAACWLWMPALPVLAVWRLAGSVTSLCLALPPCNKWVMSVQNQYCYCEHWVNIYKVLRRTSGTWYVLYPWSYILTYSNSPTGISLRTSVLLLVSLRCCGLMEGVRQLEPWGKN